MRKEKIMFIHERLFNSRTISLALEQFGKLSLREFLLFSLVGILFVVAIVLLRRLFDKKTELSDILAGIVMAVYLSIILQLTLVCRADNSRIGIELDVFHGLLGQANSYRRLMIVYVILNCMLFVPFGFVLSLFSFVHKRKAVVQCAFVILISLIVSLAIEMTQLITGRGYYEVQDVVFNVLGGFIGWVVFRVLSFVINIIAKRIMER